MPKRSAKVFWSFGSTTAPGYRVYFVRRGDTVIVLLAGGDKRTQARDINTALRLARYLQEGP